MVEYIGEQLQGIAFTVNGWVQSYGSRCVKPPIIYGDVSWPKAMTVFWSLMAQSMTAHPMKGMLTGLSPFLTGPLLGTINQVGDVIFLSDRVVYGGLQNVEVPTFSSICCSSLHWKEHTEEVSTMEYDFKISFNIHRRPALNGHAPVEENKRFSKIPDLKAITKGTRFASHPCKVVRRLPSEPSSLDSGELRSRIRTERTSKPGNLNFLVRGTEISIVLGQIPGNTGCIGRTSATSAIGLHLLENE